MMLKENIREVVNTQKKELSQLEAGIKREIEPSISMDLPFAVIISGIRRCGKSTLLRRIMKKTKNSVYFNFEDSRAAAFEAADFQKLEEVFSEGPEGAYSYFFDEIQNVPKWELFIRTMLDKNRHFLITGSNASLLSRELGTKLTGRHLKHELFPFSYNEFLRFSSKKPGPSTFGEYLQKGGFPEYLKYARSDILQELFNDIIMRDIVVRHKLRSPKILRELAIFLLTNVGKEFSYSSLAKTFGMGSTNTAVDFVSYLEDSYMLFAVPKFDYSPKKQSVNPKKIYSIDNGLSSANSISFSSDKGRMLENHVFLELRRRGKGIFYFHGERECDFLIREKNRIAGAIQVCHELTAENRERELSGLGEAMDEFGLDKGTILTFGQEDRLAVSGKPVEVVPAWKWQGFPART